jgi:AraC-like DNA-binding protein
MRRYQPARLVRKAEECLDLAPARSISLADLCAAVGVGATTLTAAFHDIYGLAPVRYLKKRRLNAARAALLKAPPRRGAVKYAALNAGLTELGRFAREYLELFGERPSATLARSGPFPPRGGRDSQILAGTSRGAGGPTLRRPGAVCAVQPG